MPIIRRLRHLAAAAVFIIALLPSLADAQQPQPTFWSADGIVALTTERVNLRARDNSSVSLPVAYVRNLVQAKQRIEQQAGLNARLFVTDYPHGGPNAFATVIDGTTVIAFNVQMMQLVGHDPDMVAAVMGHEVAHHVRGHIQEGRNREAVVELIGIIAGIALEKKIQEKHNVSGLGLNIANLGATLANRKFSRDQEREADSVGLGWLGKAGYDPNGAIRVWEKMRQAAGDNSSLFNTHPASSERIENMRREIAAMRQIAPRTSVAGSTSGPASHGSSDVAATPTTIDPTVASAVHTAMEAYREGRYERAASLWKQVERDTHDSRAQFALAMLHLQGKGVAPNRATAFAYMKKAADQGNVAAQVNISRFYLAGIATPRDPGKAREYLEKAVASGSADAKARLAFVLLSDAGTSSDADRGLKLAEEAADAGRPYGYFAKGVYYMRPPTRNDAEAATWIQKAVDS